MVKNRRHKIGDLVLSIDLEKKKSQLGQVSAYSKELNEYSIEWFNNKKNEDYDGYSYDNVKIYKQAYRKYKNKNLTDKE
jgi:hypothetical protein